LKGALAHALKTELTETDREKLREFMATLPEEVALIEGRDGESPGE